jgi:hypothetical protein
LAIDIERTDAYGGEKAAAQRYNNRERQLLSQWHQSAEYKRKNILLELIVAAYHYKCE